MAHRMPMLLLLDSHAFKSCRVTTSRWRERYSGILQIKGGGSPVLSKLVYDKYEQLQAAASFSPQGDYGPSIGCPRHFLRPLFAGVHIGCLPVRALSGLGEDPGKKMCCE